MRVNSVVDIAGRKVGDGHPCYVIAEVGINHEGNPELARRMIASAWEAGADAVKIQTFVTKDFLHPSHPGYQYDIDAELTREQEQELWDFARARGINLFSTPEEHGSLEFIRRQNPSLVKIAAMDFNYHELVRDAAGMKKPIILSSGMSDLEETLRSVRWVLEAGNPDPIVLHCVSLYPAPCEAMNLRVIASMKQALGCPVGFSDHSVGIHLPLAAVALGANVIEKHFTQDHAMTGPDHKCSMDPSELRELVRQIRELESALGHGRKEPDPAEAAPRQFKRRGVYTARSMRAGERLTRADVAFMAPSLPGCTLEDWPVIRGGLLKRDLDAAHPVHLQDVEPA